MERESQLHCRQTPTLPGPMNLASILVRAAPCAPLLVVIKIPPQRPLTSKRKRRQQKNHSNYEVLDPFPNSLMTWDEGALKMPQIVEWTQQRHISPHMCIKTLKCSYHKRHQAFAAAFNHQNYFTNSVFNGFHDNFLGDVIWFTGARSRLHHLGTLGARTS